MSIVEIANIAGVSKSTVSRVLNGTECVDPATEKQVRRVIDRLGYCPPTVKRGPRLGSRRAPRPALLAESSNIELGAS
jgi:LacI family transcriptional regulator